MKTFLQEVVEDIQLKHENISDLIFILPSKRAGTFLKRHLGATVTKTLFLPEILSIEDLIEKIAPLAFTTNPTLLFELYRIYLSIENSEKESFNAFTKWGQLLLQDFNEIDRYLIDAKAIFEDLTSIQKINSWNVENEPTTLVSNYVKFSESLYPIYTKFNKSLDDKEIGYQGKVYRNAVENLSSYIDEHQNKKHIFVGFNALNTCEETIIKELLEKNLADIYWDIDKSFLEDPIHKAGNFIRPYTKWKYYKDNTFNWRKENFSQTKKISIIGVPKYTSQVNQIASILENETAINTKKTAIVLGDEQLLNPLLNSIPKSVDSLNITMGSPLMKTPLATLFHQLFELYIKKNQKGWYHKTISNLLAHPYIQQLLGNTIANTITININANNQIFLTPTSLQKTLKQCPKAFTNLFSIKEENPKTLLQAFKELIHLLKETFSKDKEQHTLALEYLYKFYQLFNQTSELIENYPYIKSIKDLKNIYGELISSETLDFEGEPLSGLQIMGMLESRNLDFETVIISSLNEGILPAGKANNSFLPFEVKTAYKLPTYSEKDAVYTYHFYRLTQRAKNIYLIYNTEPDVLEGREKSRFIGQLLANPLENHNTKEIIASPAINPSSTALIEIKKNAAIINTLKQRAQVGFSPSALSNYVRNPIDFFNNTILKIRSYNSLEETVAANTLGTIVHDTLEKLYTPFLGQELSSATLKKALTQIEDTITFFFKKHYSNSDITTGKNLIIYHVAVRYVSNFMKSEIKDLADNSIKLVSLEQNLSHQLYIDELQETITFKGIVDRVDERNGTLRIIDYKTGKVEPRHLEIVTWDNLTEDYKYSKAFQVLFYALLLTKGTINSPIEAGIISFKNASAGFMKFTKKEQARGGKKDTLVSTETLELFTIELKNLVLELFNIEIPFLEKELEER